MAFQRTFAFFDPRVTATPNSIDRLSLLRVKWICHDCFYKAVKMSRFLTGRRGRRHRCTKLDRISAGNDGVWLSCAAVSFSAHPQHKSSSLGQSVTVHYSVQMRRLHVYALYMYLQHTLGLVRDTGVSLDQDTSLYSLYFCSNVTICRNQSSSRLRLNKYIFTVKFTLMTPPAHQRIELLCHSVGYVRCCVCLCAVTLLAMHWKVRPQ